MGFDFGQFFEDAGAKAEAALNDLVKVGVPAVQASLEQWGIDVLKQQNKETTQTLNANVAEVLAKEPVPGTLGAAFSATVKGTVLEQYGLYIVVGIVALVGIGFALRGK